MSNEWTFVPQSNVTSATATPLKPRNPQLENVHSQERHIGGDKKRGPTTPLTPSLQEKSIVKKKFLIKNKAPLAEAFDVMESGIIPAVITTTTTAQTGSPRSGRRSTTPIQEDRDEVIVETPNMVAGIKLAVKESKKSRVQMLKDAETSTAAHGNSPVLSDSDYSEVSSMDGETPNYRVEHNLLYYKNGYYIDGSVDDPFYEVAKENIVQAKELKRINDVLDFMKLERQFEDQFGK